MEGAALLDAPLRPECPTLLTNVYLDHTSLSQSQRGLSLYYGFSSLHMASAAAAGTNDGARESFSTVSTAKSRWASMIT